MASDDGKDRERTIIVRQSPLSQIRRAQPAAAPPPPEATADPGSDPFGPQAPGAPAPPPLQAAQMPRELAPDIEPDTTLPPLSVRNPLVWLASRILVRLAGMRTGQMPVTTPQFHAEMIESIGTFKDAIIEIGTDAATVDSATYAVCATVDDVMQNIPSNQGFEWARRSMVVQFFGENIGGDRFWATVDDLLRRPSGKEELLELLHACIAAGFLGKYRLTGREDRGLGDRMAAMHAELARSIPKTGHPLAPNWQGIVAPVRRIGLTAPLLVATALAACILLAAYAFFLFALSDRTETVSSDLAALHDGTTALIIERNTPPPIVVPPPPTSERLERIQAALAKQITEKTIAVEAIGPRIRITTKIGGLFKSGSDQLNPQHLPYIAAIAGSLDPEKCRITIVGHTDSDRVSTLKFPDNQALSEARAKSAAIELGKTLKDPNRIDTQGRGANEPIAKEVDNAAKALNRRIEIFVPLREEN
jgi:type VI secretion system protein ImpK